MKEFTYMITDENGLHARPAGLLVKEATKFASDILLKTDLKSADAKKIFNIMAMGIKSNDKVLVTISGSDEDIAYTDLKAFFENNL